MANEKFNEKIELLRVDSKKIGEVKTGTNSKGGSWKLTPISIQSGGVWFNGAAFTESVLEEFQSIKEGRQHYVKTWVEKYQDKEYNKFSILDESEKMQLKVDELMLLRRFILSDEEVNAKYNEFKQSL